MKFSSRSLDKLSSCHIDLQLIAKTSIDITPIDFGISEGHRSLEKQQEYFNKGLSKIDGINKKGKHNYDPSMAFDFYIYVPGKKLSYDKYHLTFVAGLMIAIAKMLILDNKITHDVRWGGNWDSDGELISDQSFDDLPHIELIKLWH